MTEKVYVAKESTSLAIQGDTQEILTKLSGGGGITDTVVLALLSNNDAQIDWAFRQNGIGSALNAAFGLNSAALEACNTVNEIAASTAALDAIKTNADAVVVCCKNPVLVQKFSDEDIIAVGAGYKKFSVADLVMLNYNGKDTKFRVVHKDYLTKGKIVLLSEDCVSQKEWNTTSRNNYSTSTIRAHLNSTVLNGFSQKIQNAITTPDLPCHDYKVAIILKDKIWLPSCTEVGYATDQYAPVEGSVFDYYNGASNDKRIKEFNNNAVYWWLRTPSAAFASDAWRVSNNGSASSNSVQPSEGVAFAFEI